MHRLSATVALAVVTAACGSSGARAHRKPAPTEGASAAAPPDAAAAPAAAGPPVRAPDSTAGLHHLIAAVMKAVARGHDADARRLVNSFRLARPEAWFAHTFGRRWGRRLARDYRPGAKQIDQLVLLFRRLQSSGRTHVVVERFTAPTPAVVGYQKLALERMKTAVALYSVRLVRRGQETGFHLWSFVYAGGSFRWVGKMKALAGGSAAHTDTGPDLLELRLREADKLKALAAGGASQGAAAGRAAHGARHAAGTHR